MNNGYVFFNNEIGIYYVKPSPFETVVKYENGTLSIAENFKGESISTTEFIDKLLVKEHKNYLTECIPIAKKIDRLARKHSMAKYKEEMSLNSSML